MDVARVFGRVDKAEKYAPMVCGRQGNRRKSPFGIYRFFYGVRVELKLCLL